MTKYKWISNYNWIPNYNLIELSDNIFDKFIKAFNNYSMREILMSS